MSWVSRIFKGMAMANGFVGDMARAMDPESDEGRNISQEEIIQMTIRGIFRVAMAMGAELSNVSMSNEEFMQMIKRELDVVLKEGV